MFMEIDYSQLKSKWLEPTYHKYHWLCLQSFKKKKESKKKRKVTLESDDSGNDDVETSNVIQQMAKHSLIDTSDKTVITALV